MNPENMERDITLFISVDIVHSTPSKQVQTKDGGVYVWTIFFDEFYRWMQEEFPNSLRGKTNGEIKTWKANGDEILYFCDLDVQSTNKLWDTVEPFLVCLEPLREKIKDLGTTWPKKLELVDNKKFSVSLKTTIWCAPVPFRNVAVKNREIDDYIGPEIDLGFRLAGLSSEENTTICPITALLLEETGINKASNGYKVWFRGFHKLKGFDSDVPVHAISKKGNQLGFNTMPSTVEMVNYINKAYPYITIPGRNEFPGNPHENEKADATSNEIRQLMRPIFPL